MSDYKTSIPEHLDHVIDVLRLIHTEFLGVLADDVYIKRLKSALNTIEKLRTDVEINDVLNLGL